MLKRFQEINVWKIFQNCRPLNKLNSLTWWMLTWEITQLLKRTENNYSSKIIHNGQFKQCLGITITGKKHDGCLHITKTIKKQSEASYFSVTFNESKSARSGPVLQRTLMIYQIAHARDILIFKEAIRRICQYFSINHNAVTFTDRGTEPVNELRKGISWLN